MIGALLSGRDALGVMPKGAGKSLCYQIPAMLLPGATLETAKEEHVPAFVVFSDATLVDMCQKHPRPEDGLLAVSGVGRVKLERYGKRFMELLCRQEAKALPDEAAPELTAELFSRQVEINGESIQISRMADNLNAVLLRYGKSETSGAKLNSLLLEASYLQTVDGVKLPTAKGRELGITAVPVFISQFCSDIQCELRQQPKPFVSRELVPARTMIEPLALPAKTTRAIPARATFWRRGNYSLVCALRHPTTEQLHITLYHFISLRITSGVHFGPT